MKKYSIYEFPVGKLLIEEAGGVITKISTDLGSEGLYEETLVIRDTCEQLREYFRGERNSFTVEVGAVGTEFQMKVWEALRAIPYGETRTYGEIAAQIGNPKAARAVGGACNKNPILILIPCHRVVGANGSLVGFAAGLPAKEKLLHLEKVHLDA